MRKQRQTILALLLTLVLLALVYWAGQDQQQVRLVTLVALKETVPAGTQIKPEHLQQVEIPEHQVLSGYLSDPVQAVGLWSSTELQAGELLLATRVIPKANGITYPNPRPGRRLITIELKSGDANGYYLAAGNRVDLHLVPKQQQVEADTETIRSVLVVAVLGTDGQPLKMPLKSTGSTALLCLDVTPAQAQRLAEAQSRALIKASVVNEPD